MTASNIFARENGTWLFFDTAVYDDDGFVRRFESKVEVSQSLRMAIGVCGRLAPNRNDRIRSFLATQPSQSDALAAIPALLSDLASDVDDGDNRARWWERWLWKSRPPVNEPGIRLLVGWWDSAAARGAAGVISNVDDLGPAYPPNVLNTARIVTSPSPDFGDWFDYDDHLGEGLTFDPKRDGAALAAFERAHPNQGRGSRVGGSFERFHVHAGGVDRETIVTWPDRIGRPIKLTA